MFTRPYLLFFVCFLGCTTVQKEWRECIMVHDAIKCTEFEGDIKKREYFLDIDSNYTGIYKEYHRNGCLSVVGEYYSGMRVNYFQYFDSNFVLRKQELYTLDIENNLDSTILSEYIEFSENGDTIMSSSYFLTTKFEKDTILIGDSIKCSMLLRRPNFDSLEGYFNYVLDSEFPARKIDYHKAKSTDGKGLEIKFGGINIPGYYIIAGLVYDYSDTIVEAEQGRVYRSIPVMIPFVVLDSLDVP